MVPSLVDSSRRFFLLPSFVREKEEKKKFEKGMIIIVFFSFAFLSFLINDDKGRKFNLIKFRFDAISREVLLQ